MRSKAGLDIRSVWLCDDAAGSNGKEVWYLLGSDGAMLTAGLVQDQSGNYYSLETEHNGYYGMMRYRSGTYNCNGSRVYIEFSQKHDGTFGAITNQDAVDRLRAIYGLAKFDIGSENCVYTNNLK